MQSYGQYVLYSCVEPIELGRCDTATGANATKQPK